MKEFVWFLAGAIAGAMSLAIIQETLKPTPVEDMKIAVAPPFTPDPTPTRGATTTAAPPVQFFNGQWTNKVSVTTPRPHQIQGTQSVPAVSAPHSVQAVPVASTPSPKPKGEEVSVFLDREQQINTRSGSYRIFVHDHGSETISVKVGFGPYTRVKKAMGTDTVGDNKVLIYSDGSVRLFHVNTPRAPQNCCLIEVVSAA